ncbi:Asp-tRNA(Asn)/Glu-tRNA(Gln) amidotransferase subunit GatA [Patescibacteria group bacterium]
MNDLIPLSVEEIQKGLSKKDFSAEELTCSYLDNIRKEEPRICAFLSVFEKSAIKEAKKIDKALKDEKREAGILEGVPIAIKDNILIKGEKATAGSKILEPYIASYDAFVIERLRNAGAIFLGKTNCDEFAMGSSCENSAFGPTKNPHDTERVPGGSSGGSAAAIGVQETPVALGSDTGGSIRQPASFCGVVGLKPTYGAVSRNGLIAMASSLDQIGPLARNVRDAEILFNIISGKDAKDSTSQKIIQKELKEKKFIIGIPKEYFVSGISADVEKSVKKAIKDLEDAGHTIKEINLPHTAYALACYYIIMPAEASSNLARFDGMRYGLSKKEKNLISMYKESRSQGFGTEVRRRILLGTYVLSSGYYEAYYERAQKVRTLIRNDFKSAFNDVDLIATPVAPTTAFKIGEKVNDPLAMYLEDVYTVPISLAGLPAISIPCGKSENLPIGLQIIGKPFCEQDLFDIGKQYEKIRGDI